MNKTKEFMIKSWPLLINALVGVIIVIFILFFNFSLSKYLLELLIYQMQLLLTLLF